MNRYKQKNENTLLSVIKNRKTQKRLKTLKFEEIIERRWKKYFSTLE